MGELLTKHRLITEKPLRCNTSAVQLRMAENTLAGNSVGSRAALSELTKKQKELIIGCVLGDGHVRKLAGRQYAFLEINHSIKAKEYVEWKYSLLKEIVKSPPQKRRQNKGIFKEAYRFTTRQHPFIEEVYKKFYKDGKKVIPKGFTLTPFILAVWFMDDGSSTKKGDIYLNTQQFDLKSQRRLLHALRQLQIKARLNKDRRYYRIRIKKESRERFIELISPYVIDAMKYKLKAALTP